MAIEYVVPDVWAADARFSCPDNINDSLSLVNRLFFDAVSLVDTDGTVYGFFATMDGQEHIQPVPCMRNDTEKVVLMLGELNPGITFDSLTEAKAFVKGLFYFAYHFKTVEEIESYLSSRRAIEVSNEKLAIDWMAFLCPW